MTDSFVQLTLGMKPICFAAMQKRTFKSYRNLFRGLKEACRRAGFDLSPVAHLMDFEYAAARASKEVFPQTKQIFCHFHFAKSIWRNL